MDQEKRSLFIIGNGFDLHHDLPTKYTAFIDFIELEYPELYGWLYDSVKRYSLGYWDIIDKVPNGYFWNNMEELLGDFESLEMVEEHRDWDSPKDYKGPPSEEIQKLLYFGLNISQYLNVWLKKVEKDLEGLSSFKTIKSLFKKEDLFLTFNYTRTLEKIYNLENVFHIHGITGEQLVMGRKGTTTTLLFSKLGVTSEAEAEILQLALRGAHVLCITKSDLLCVEEKRDFYELLMQKWLELEQIIEDNLGLLG